MAKIIKMKDLLEKEGIELGKVYTDKTMPPFKVNEEHIINFSKEEMAKLHKDGKLEKDGHTYTFSEGKLNEAKTLRLPNGVKVKIDFKGITFVGGGRGKPVFLDRGELAKFFMATSKYLRYEGVEEGGPGSGPQGNGDDEDNPFDREPTDDEMADIEKQFEGKLNEVDFNKIKLPSVVNRFLNRFVQSMKDSKLNRVKRSAILYKVIHASGLSVSQLSSDIQKIKKELK